jgi:hypothetical protein
MICPSKIVVFDLDETLGYFTEFGIFWDALKEYIILNHFNREINEELFNKVLDIYPEFIRPNIIDILSYLKKKKQQNHCHKLMVYTNNQGPTEWAKLIIKYFETKINYGIFDQIIAAFKVRGKQVEICRTSHEKSYNDLLRCSKLPEETQVCFVDDVYHPNMSNKNVYYINVKAYIYDLDFEDMVERFVKSNIINIGDPMEFKDFILNYVKKYNYTHYVSKTKEMHNIDIIISKKILQHLQMFFKIKPSTRRNKSIRRFHDKNNSDKNNKTIKNVRY